MSNKVGSFEYVGGFHHSQLTPEICVRLVQSNGKLLLRIPSYLRTNDVLVAAVRSAPRIIKDIHPREITDEMYRVAVEMDRSLVQFIPNACRTWQDYLELWKTGNIKFETLIQNTPVEHLQTMYNEVIDANPKLLKHVPAAYRTRETCVTCILANVPDVFDLIPKHLLDQDMYNLLVEKTHISPKLIPEGYFTESIAEKLVCYSSENLQYIPKQYITKALIVKCMSSYQANIKNIPTEHLDADVYKLHFARSLSLEGIPTQYWTEEMILIHHNRRAWHRCKLYFEHFPKHLQTDLVKLVLSKDS